MDDLVANKSFVIYCLAAVALCLNMMLLWAYSGAVRSRTKTTPNAEDAASVAKGAAVTLDTPPGVARVLRAHRNALDNIVPFLILGLLYVLLGATTRMAWIMFGGFTAARFLHTLAYLGEKQPWRTLSFVAGGLFTFGVLVQISRATITLLMR